MSAPIDDAARNSVIGGCAVLLAWPVCVWITSLAARDLWNAVLVAHIPALSPITHLDAFLLRFAIAIFTFRSFTSPRKDDRDLSAWAGSNLLIGSLFLYGFAQAAIWIGAK